MHGPKLVVMKKKVKSQGKQRFVDFFFILRLESFIMRCFNSFNYQITTQSFLLQDISKFPGFCVNNYVFKNTLSHENKKALDPLYHKNIFDRKWMYIFYVEVFLFSCDSLCLI